MHGPVVLSTPAGSPAGRCRPVVGSMLGRWLVPLLAAALVGPLTACGAAPRFDPEIQQGFMDSPPHRFETDRLRVYYPEHRREDAERIAVALETCLTRLDGLAVRPMNQRRIPVFIPDSEFNNAYVMPPLAGEEGHTVIPPHFSLDFFGELGLSLSPGLVACHEVVHVMHAQQVHGLIADMNRVFGPLFSPQIGFDPWFWEGLAVYYETALNPGMGRMASPLWRQTFRSGYADRRFRAGDLSVGRTNVPYGSWYLNGSHFVEWLAETHGEEKLWELIDRQSNAFFFPFGVGGRFQRTYGRSLGGLVRDFADHLEATLEPRDRPPDQRVVRTVGREPLHIQGPEGRMALVSERLDRPTRIEVFDADGRRILRRSVPDLLPPRTVTIPVLSGLAFSPEGDALYFVGLDLGVIRLESRLYRLDIPSGRVRIVARGLRGGGGDLSPDGCHYVYPRRDTDGTTLVAVDVRDGTLTPLHTFPLGHHILHPRFRPDGRALAAARFVEGSQQLVRLDFADAPPSCAGSASAAGVHGDGQAAGLRVTPLAAAGDTPMHPTWVDRSTLLYTRRVEDTMQVAVIDADGQQSVVLTQAPWLAAHPWPVRDRLRFLNLDGFDWTLDEVVVGDLREQLRAAGAPSMIPEGATAQASDGSRSDAARESERHGGEADPLAGPAAPLSARPLAEVQVRNERRYRMTERLLLPRSRFAYLFMGPDETLVGGAVAGRDELGFHNWGASVDWGLDRERLGWQAAYVNIQLAPLVWGVSGGDSWTVATVTAGEADDGEDDEEGLVHDRLRSGSLMALLALRSQQIAVELVGAQQRQDALGPDPWSAALVGPRLTLLWAAGRGAARVPVHSALVVAGQGAWFAEGLGSDVEVGDLRAEVQVFMPTGIPRTTLRLRGVERALLTNANVPLLRVGGQPTEGQQVWGAPERERPEAPALSQVLPFSFSEPVRGFEGRGFLGDRLTLGEATLQWSLPVERGLAGVLWVLPSVLWYAVDLQAFGSAFVVDGDTATPQAAVGASADLWFLVGLIPLAVRYQMSVPLTDADRPAHLVLLGVGL